jgi:hypothetical protein
MGTIIDKLYYHPQMTPFWDTLAHLGEYTDDYYKTIKKPIDLITVWNNVEDYRYSLFSDFCKDVFLVFSNCREFNAKGSSLYETSLQMDDYFKILIEPVKKANLTLNVKII